MTTKITVDAHAGWPVLVRLKRGEPHAQKSDETVLVEPGTTMDFYIHSGLIITGIEETNADPSGMKSLS